MINKKIVLQTTPRNSQRFIRFVRRQLHYNTFEPLSFDLSSDYGRISAVLFLLSLDAEKKLSLILNKRSNLVRQPGDLCCPGGGITPAVDSRLARIIDLPFAPLFSWPYREYWKGAHRSDYSKLKLILATALREGVEEMKLNPFGVEFLGCLPVQQLVMFKRTIYPLAVWVRSQHQFFPNWEVEKIIRIPLQTFFEPAYYARFRLKSDEKGDTWEMPCFVHRQRDKTELLWGATYRITMLFLQTVFGFSDPPLAARPIVPFTLSKNYYTGYRN